MLDKLKEILSIVMPEVDTSAVTEETKLRDELGFDSLSIMMLAIEIEDTFGFKFTEFIPFKTVGEVCEYIDAHKMMS